MKVEIKSCYSPDIDDLKSHKPKQADSFCFLLTIFIGVEGEEGEDTLDFIVCTPKYLINEHEEEKESEGVIFGKNYLIVFEYNFENILNQIKKLIDSIEEDTWGAIGQRLSRYGKWEFEDYKEE